MQTNQYKTSGFIFAVAHFSRPSYIVFYVVGLIYLFVFKKESLSTIFGFFTLGALLFFVFIFANEGILYINEAKRFTEGHFTLWGTGQNSEYLWYQQLFILPNLIFILLPIVFIRFQHQLKLYYILFISYLVWILVAQNPDNLRHLIPVVFFANILLSPILSQYNKLFLIPIIFFNLSFYLNSNEKTSPLENILNVIQQQNTTIITNRGIEIFRKYQHNSIVDKYYLHSSHFIDKNQPSKTVSTQKPKNKDYREFKGRFLGEKTHYLY